MKAILNQLRGARRRPVTTVTVNQWRITDNATYGTNDPVLCLHTYTHRDPNGGWGECIEGPVHFHEVDIPKGRVVYNPADKTPCGASCWMEYEGRIPPRVAPTTRGPRFLRGLLPLFMAGLCAFVACYTVAYFLNIPMDVVADSTTVFPACLGIAVVGLTGSMCFAADTFETVFPDTYPEQP